MLIRIDRQVATILQLSCIEEILAFQGPPGLTAYTRMHAQKAAQRIHEMTEITYESVRGYMSQQNIPGTIMPQRKMPRMPNDGYPSRKPEIAIQMGS